VSVLTTPYEWLSDETVLLPAILQAAALVFAARAQLKAVSKVVLVGFACLNVLLLLILRFKIPFSTGIYFWSSLVWFGWYFYARRVQRKAVGAGAPVSADASS
jgi:thiamine transporter ThiT